MSVEGTVELLWNCANALPITADCSKPEAHTKKLLKSYYINTCRKVARNSLQVPKEKFGASQMCPRCSCFWTENEFHLKLQPQKVRSAKAKKLIAKLQLSQTTRQTGLLTQKQRRRAKWLQKRVTSNMEIHCDFCKHKTLVPLEKPNQRRKPTMEVEEITEPDISSLEKVKKKKHKKKKDPTAGLKNVPTAIKTDFNKVAAQQPPLQNSTTKVRKQPAQTVKRTVSTTSTKAQLNQALKAKSKNKNKQKKTVPTPKVQSNTQQKHALLQLASLLKTQTSQSGKNRSQNRLDLLLK